MSRPLPIPPILKDAERLVVAVDQAVRRFPRYHRYASGEELRRRARKVFLKAALAWRDRQDQPRRVRKLCRAIDAFRQELQVAKLLNATASFGQFEVLARETDKLGRQAGGWKRQLHPRAQSAQGRAP